MATKEITNADPRLEEELIIDHEDAEVYRGKSIARLSLLWQERRFLLRCAAIGMVISIVIVLLIPVRFTSTTRLMPPDQAGAGMASMLAALGKGSGGGSDLGMIGSEMLGLRTSSDLFVGILHSRTIQDQLVNKFDLRKEYGTKRWEDARKTLDKLTDVQSDRKSGIITLKVSDHDPKRAAGLAQEYVAGLNQIVLTLNTSSAHKEREFLEQRLGQVKGSLEKAERDFGDFASKNTAIDVKEQGKAMLGAAAEVEGQLIAAQTELESLRQIYTANNVRVRAVQARIEEFQRQLQKMGGKSASSTDVATPPSSEELYPPIRQLPILGIAYADLYREAKVQEAVFETLTKQYEMAKVEEARETPSVKVLDEGDVPEGKSFPPRTLLVALGIFLSFVVGSVWVLTSTWWHALNPQDPGKKLLQEVAGTVRARVGRVSGRKFGGRISRFDPSRSDISTSHLDDQRERDSRVRDIND